MHIHELLPYRSYRYFHQGKPLYFIAIGWLEAPFSYKRGPVPVDFFNKIAKWCSDPHKYGVVFMRGWHEPTIEKVENAESWYEEEKYTKLPKYPRANGEIHVKYKGNHYATPMMIYQYIHEYGYHPPQEFIEAVLEGELIDSDTLETYAQKEQEQATQEELAQKSRAQEHSAQCEKYFSSGDYSAAKKEAKLSLELEPSDVRALFFLAQISYETKQFEAAYTMVNKALSERPSIEPTRALRGLILVELNRLQEAEEELLYILPNLRKTPGNNLVQILYHLGKIAQKKRNYAEAKSYYREALDIEPGAPDIKRSLRNTKIQAFFNSIFGKST